MFYKQLTISREGVMTSWQNSIPWGVNFVEIVSFQKQELKARLDLEFFKKIQQQKIQR